MSFDQILREKQENGRDLPCLLTSIVAAGLAHAGQFFCLETSCTKWNLKCTPGAKETVGYLKTSVAPPSFFRVRQLPQGTAQGQALSQPVGAGWDFPGDQAWSQDALFPGTPWVSGVFLGHRDTTTPTVLRSQVLKSQVRARWALLCSETSGEGRRGCVLSVSVADPVRRFLQ